MTWCNMSSPTVHVLPNVLESVPLEFVPINPVFRMFLVRCMATAMRRPAQKTNIPQYFRFLEAPHLGIFRSRLDQHLFPWPTLFCKPGACSFLGGSSPWGPLSRSRGPGPACVLRQLLLLQSPCSVPDADLLPFRPPWLSPCSGLALAPCLAHQLCQLLYDWWHSRAH